MIRKTEQREATFSVVVIGGGLAGCCAAVACARAGVRTALVQDRPVLGGNASSEIRMHVCGASTNGTKLDVEETGILYEIMLTNKKYNERYNYSVWDAVLYEFVKKEKGLTLFMNTTMTSVECSNNSIKRRQCYQMTTEIHWTICGNIFIDASGKGTLGYLAGVPYRTGSESSEEFQEPHAPKQSNHHRMGNTLLFKAYDCGHPVEFEKPPWANSFTEEQLKYRKHGNAASLYGIDVTKKGVTILDDFEKKSPQKFDAYCLDYGYWWVELCGKKYLMSEYEEIRDDLIGCIYGIWDHIKNGGDHGADNFDLLWVGMLPGERETRRLEGAYILTENDILGNRVFDDSVAYGGWPMDNHTPNGLLDFDKLPTELYSFPGVYGIPYRCYYSPEVLNLLFAGKIISCSKLAMSSTRVMGTCAVGGQAVGTAAAMCIKRQCTPADILNHIDALQQELLRNDCYIPGIVNRDMADILHNASAFSKDCICPASNVLNGVARNVGNQENWWRSGSLPATITIELAAPTTLKEVQVTFDTNLSRPIKQTMSSIRIAQQSLGLPPELVKTFDLKLYQGDKMVYGTQINDNYLRMVRVNIPGIECTRIVITVLKTYGLNEARIFEIRAY